MKTDIKKLFGVFPDTRKFFDFPLSRMTSFKTGGNAPLVFSPADVDELAQAVDICRRNEVNFYVLGRATNVLVSDSGIDGVVIRVGKDMSKIRVEGETIYAEAGATMVALSNTAAENGLSGLEFCCGIPGTLGGGIVMNAGAYGGEIKDITASVTVLDGCRRLEFSGASCEFSYRSSRFQEENSIITGAVLRLEKGDAKEIRARMADFNARRVSNTPAGQPSAGSVFKRPKNDYAARLIEEAGLKGLKIGGAEVSKIHSGFIVNTGGATSADIYKLLLQIREIVYNKFGIILETEIKLIGDFCREAPSGK